MNFATSINDIFHSLIDITFYVKFIINRRIKFERFSDYKKLFKNFRKQFSKKINSYLLFFICLLGFIYDTYFIISQYLLYPTLVNIQQNILIDNYLPSFEIVAKYETFNVKSDQIWRYLNILIIFLIIV
jgi:hypothetical protein